MKITPFREKLLIFLGIILITQGMVGFSKDTGHGTDGQTQGAIERRLTMDTRVNSELIGVSVENGHVKLFGTVESLEEKAMANSIASSVVGVQSVMSAIRVKPKVSKDQKIQNSIQHLILETGIHSPKTITVRVADGVVTLEGNVSQKKDKQAAFRLAQSVKGVREVENLLQVVEPDRPDKAIYNDVILYLMWSPLVDINQLKVEVKNGVVSLKGRVDHLAYRDVLTIDLENIQGVKEVKVGKVIPQPLMTSPSPATNNH